MDPTSLRLLTELLDAPGPSGFESAPARVWRREAAFADEVRSDVAGNSFATVNPAGAPRVMFAGHVDEIGLMIVHVDDEGYLYFEPIGGWDHQVFVGQRVRLLTKDGTIPGVIGKRAIHLIEPDDRSKASKASDLWIDIGAHDKADALGMMRIGDAGILDSHVTVFPNDRLVSKSLDNRVGAFVVLEALRRLAADRPAAAAVTAVATCQEEIAYTGGGARTSAAGLTPDIAVVVDVTHATDYPGVEKKRIGDLRLGGGPVLSRGSVVSPVIFDLLREAAEAEGIPYMVQAAPRETSTDADAIFTATKGIATGLVSVPLRYMHSPNEMVVLKDLDLAAGLLAAFARRLTAETALVPG